MKTLLFAIALMAANCTNNQKSDGGSTTPDGKDCRCFLLRSGYELLSGGSFHSVRTNSSRTAIDSGKTLRVEAELTLDEQNKKGVLGGRVVLPYFDLGGEKHLVELRIDLDDNQLAYRNYAAEYCTLYEVCKDPNNPCDIAPDKREFFHVESQKLAAIHLRPKPAAPQAAAPPRRAPAPATGGASPKPLPTVEVTIEFPKGADGARVELPTGGCLQRSGRISAAVSLPAGEQTVRLAGAGGFWSATFDPSEDPFVDAAQFLFHKNIY